MAAFSNISNCSGDLECDTCTVGTIYHKWRQAYLVPQVRINMGITATLSAVTCPVTVGLNGLVIYTIFSNPVLRDVPANLSVALLCITDFLVGITTQPLFIGIVICRMSGRCLSCIFEQILLTLLNFFYIASIYHLAIISTDRLIAVKLPYRYQILVTSRKIMFCSILVWSFCFVTTCILLVTGLLDQDTAQNLAISFFVFDVIVIFIVVASYVAIYLEARRHHKNIQAEIAKHQQLFAKETLKATKTTFMVSCSVLGTYVVNVLVLSCMFYGFPPSNSLFNAKVYFSAVLWSTFIMMLSSFLNPFIYILSSEKFSKEVKKTLGLKTTKVKPQQNFELQPIRINVTAAVVQP